MENDRLQEIKKGTDLKLAPETMRIRDAIIEKYLDTPLDMLSSKLQALITEETDTGTKLGIFSARVEILRMRFAEIADKKYIKDNKIGKNEEIEKDGDVLDDGDQIKEGWMTLKILEASEVNGVRFPEGVKIDVHADDAKKLLESKKAELVSMKIEDAALNTVEIDEDQESAKDSETSEIRTEEQKVDSKEAIKPSKDTGDAKEDDTSLNPEEMADLNSGVASAEVSPEEKEQKVDSKEAIKPSKDAGDAKEDDTSLNPEEMADLEKK